MILLATAVFAVDACASSVVDLQKDQLRQVKKRFVAELVLLDVPADGPFVEQHIAWLDKHADELLAMEAGYWTQFDDVSHPRISFDGAAFRLPDYLAKAYSTPMSRHYQREPVRKAMEAGLRDLLQFAYPGCPKPNNWWAWRIGIPRRLLRTLIMMEGQMDPVLFERGVQTVTHLLKTENDVKLTGPWIPAPEGRVGKTDMNQLWRYELRLRLAALIENPAMAGKWSELTFAEMAPAGQGWWQADGSYKFHGAIPMWAYGRVILIDYARLVHRYNGTDFGPRPQQLARFAAMLKQYVNGFLYRNVICPAMTGREITSGACWHHAPFVLESLAVMAQTDRADAETFGRLLAREQQFVVDPGQDAGLIAAFLANAPQAKPAPPINDIMAYPDSDFLQITRANWAVGIKMHSARNRGYESINGENLQGWFLSHGSMFPLLSGREWDGCWPTLDWTRLPGTTVAVELKGQNQSPFVGVLRASPEVAVAAQELRIGDFRARKSWHVDRDHIACVGSDIMGPGRVETTVVNQPVSTESVLLIDGRAPSPGEFESTMRIRWLWLDNIGYVFPEVTELRVLRRRRASDWTSVREERRHGAGQLVSHDYITAVITHGPEVKGYAYLVIPNTPRAEMPQQVEQVLERYEVHRSGAHRVAARDGNVESIVLWDKGQADQVQADRGCMLLRFGDAWQAVDPAWVGQPLQVQIGAEPYTVDPLKGRPVSIK